MYYAISFWTKDTQEDHYEQGCIGHATSCVAEYLNFSSPSLQGVIDHIDQNYCKVTGIHLDSDDDSSVLCCSEYECEDTTPPTPEEYELWKNGHLKLWLCDYRFHIEKRIVSPVSEDEFKALGIPYE
jgi:hypothetical protein